MGKKKIITAEETNTEPMTDASQVGSVSDSSKKTRKRQVLNGIAHINVSYNNTIIAISDSKGEVIAWSSAGLLGYRGTKKSTPYVANLVARDVVERAKGYSLNSVKVIVKGIGPGRESAIRGIVGMGLNITSIMDATPIAHNGVRKKKPRRV